MHRLPCWASFDVIGIHTLADRLRRWVKGLIDLDDRERAVAAPVVVDVDERHTGNQGDDFAIARVDRSGATHDLPEALELLRSNGGEEVRQPI